MAEGQAQEMQETTLALIRRDIEDIKEMVKALAETQKGIAEEQHTQAVTCASTCSAAGALRDAIVERLNSIENRVEENEKSIKGLFTGNAILSIVGSVIAAVWK